MGNLISKQKSNYIFNALFNAHKEEPKQLALRKQLTLNYWYFFLLTFFF